VRTELFLQTLGLNG